LIAAAVNGFGAAILWVAQGEYISTCANDKNKGQYNSIFWSLLMLSSIIGNLMAAYVIVSVK
jgi:MFS family permease